MWYISALADHGEQHSRLRGAPQEENFGDDGSRLGLLIASVSHKKQREAVAGGTGRRASVSAESRRPLHCREPCKIWNSYREHEDAEMFFGLLVWCCASVWCDMAASRIDAPLGPVKNCAADGQSSNPGDPDCGERPRAKCFGASHDSPRARQGVGSCGCFWERRGDEARQAWGPVVCCLVARTVGDQCAAGGRKVLCSSSPDQNQD